MSDFFEQKKNSQKHFRDKINQFIKQSPSIQIQNQLDQSILTSILSSKGDVVQNGRINLQKLFQLLKTQEHGYSINLSDFRTIFGPQKYLKVSDLQSVLKQLNLNSFDLKSQIKSMCFQNKKFSFDKLDKQMKKIGYTELNRKNKQLLLDSFDFNNDHIIDQQDLNALIDLIQNRNQPK